MRIPNIDEMRDLKKELTPGRVRRFTNFLGDFTDWILFVASLVFLCGVFLIVSRFELGVGAGFSIIFGYLLLLILLAVEKTFYQYKISGLVRVVFNIKTSSVAEDFTSDLLGNGEGIWDLLLANDQNSSNIKNILNDFIIGEVSDKDSSHFMSASGVNYKLESGKVLAKVGEKEGCCLF